MGKSQRKYATNIGQVDATYQALFENAVVGIYQTNLAGQFVKANTALARILQYDSADELMNNVRNVANELYVDPSERQKIIDVLLKDGAISAFECEFYRKDRSRAWLRLHARVVRDSSGEPLFYEGMIEDISSNKEAREKLVEQTSKLETVNRSLRSEIIQRKLAEEISRRQKSSLAKSLDQLATEPELDQFIGLVFEVIAEQLEADSGTFWIFDEKAQEIRMYLDYMEGRIQLPVLSDHPYSSNAVPIEHIQGWSFDTHTKDLTAKLFKEQMGKNRDFVTDDKISEWNKKHKIRSWLSVPMVFGNQIVGILSIRSSNKDHFDGEDEQLVVALANQVTLAVEIARLAAQHQENAILEERNRIAREIHDTLAQSLSVIVVQLEAAQELFQDDPEKSKLHICRAAEQARSGLREARSSLRALRPLDRQINLFERIQGLVEDISSTSDVEFSVTSNKGIPRFDFNMEENLFRIVREGLHNSIRHGEPSACSVLLEHKTDSIELSISDDGRGFNADQINDTQFGLLGMKERVNELGGQFNIKSQPGKGTALSLSIPIREGMVR